LKTKELAFLGAKNKLFFECKKGQSEPKEWRKMHPWCGIEPE
jgi:hypothetical protein